MTRQKNLFIVIALMIMAITLTSAKSFRQHSFDIKITNIKKNSGKIIVEIYNSETSWLKTPFQKMELSSNQDVQTATFKVPYGKYAITIYQDLNNNGEADMNFLGIPKELVAFGNNYKPFGEPKFESCLVEFNVNSKPQEIKLYKVL
jgi:uncharacterized protein (DUF2141 family)